MRQSRSAWLEVSGLKRRRVPDRHCGQPAERRRNAAAKRLCEPLHCCHRHEQPAAARISAIPAPTAPAVKSATRSASPMSATTTSEGRCFCCSTPAATSPTPSPAPSRPADAQPRQPSQCQRSERTPSCGPSTSARRCRRLAAASPSAQRIAGQTVRVTPASELAPRAGLVDLVKANFGHGVYAVPQDNLPPHLNAAGGVNANNANAGDADQLPPATVWRRMERD
jgi:hypothetical protein